MRTTRLIIAGLLLAVTATACSIESEPSDTETTERYFTVNPERAFVVDPRNGVGDFDAVEWCSQGLAFTTTRLTDSGADTVAISTVRVPERDADCGAGKS